MADIDRLIGFMAIMQVPFMNDPDALAYIEEVKTVLKQVKAQEVPDTNAGKWTTERTQEHDGEWYCSECGYEPVVMSDDMKYCPGCGRKMTMPEPPKEEA